MRSRGAAAAAARAKSWRGGSGSAGARGRAPRGAASRPATGLHQLASRSGVAPMRWIDRSAPSNSSSCVSRRPTKRLSSAVDDEAAGQAPGDRAQRADRLRRQRDAAQAAQRLLPEDARGDAAPGAAQAVQRPHAQHVVDLPAVLRQREHAHEDRARDRAGHQRADRMHQVGAGAHRHQAGQRPVVGEARVVAAHHAPPPACRPPWPSAS